MRPDKIWIAILSLMFVSSCTPEERESVFVPIIDDEIVNTASDLVVIASDAVEIEIPHENSPCFLRVFSFNVSKIERGSFDINKRLVVGVQDMSDQYLDQVRLFTIEVDSKYYEHCDKDYPRSIEGTKIRKLLKAEPG